VVIPFGTGWLFGPAAEGSSLPGFDDSGLDLVTLPHTVAPLSWQDWRPAAWERVWVYRKHFDAPFEAGLEGRQAGQRPGRRRAAGGGAGDGGRLRCRLGLDAGRGGRRRAAGRRQPV
jgi:hypothetical protein